MFLLTFGFKTKSNYFRQRNGFTSDYSNPDWDIPKKSKQRGLRIYFSEKKNLKFLDLSLFPYTQGR